MPVGRDRRNVLFQIAQQQTIQMQRRTRALVNCVRPVGVFHEVHRLIQFDQPIQQKLGPGVVDIVITRPVHHQQMPAQSFRVIDG